MSCFQIKSKKYDLENTSHTKMCVSRIFYEIPLTFTAKEANSTLKIQQNGSAPTLKLEYNLNDSGWTTYTQGNIITLENVGDMVQMRATEVGNSTFSSSSTNYNYFVMTGKIAAYGNIQSLLDQTMTKMDVPLYCYQHMFQGCTSLTQAPELPAITLGDNCYRYMFKNCTSLTSAPDLPSTILFESCYEYMFQGCTSLTQAPELPAKALAHYCYYYMFQGCTSLTQAPELPAITLGDNCYRYMFQGCTSLTQAPELPAITLSNSCYRNMFQGCTSLTQAPSILPATTMTSYCYQSMFSNCISLTQAPVLLATTLYSNCYVDMFYGCTHITSVTMKNAVKPYDSSKYGDLGNDITINYVD